LTHNGWTISLPSGVSGFDPRVGMKGQVLFAKFESPQPPFHPRYSWGPGPDQPRTTLPECNSLDYICGVHSDGEPEGGVIAAHCFPLRFGANRMQQRARGLRKCAFFGSASLNRLIFGPWIIWPSQISLTCRTLQQKPRYSPRHGTCASQAARRKRNIPHRTLITVTWRKRRCTGITLRSRGSK